MLPTKTFYRVGHTDTNQGLWYDQQGNFTGNIHTCFGFCKNTNLQMDRDDAIVGHLSVTDSLEELYAWFPKEDILRLQEHGYVIQEFEAEDYFFYLPFQHFVINQQTSVLTTIITLEKERHALSELATS